MLPEKQSQHNWGKAGREDMSSQHQGFSRGKVLDCTASKARSAY